MSSLHPPIELLTHWAKSVARRWRYRVEADELLQEGVLIWLSQLPETPEKLKGSRVYWAMFRYAATQVYGSIAEYRRDHKRKTRPERPHRERLPEHKRLENKRAAAAVSRANPVNRESERARKKAAYWRDKGLRVNYSVKPLVPPAQRTDAQQNSADAHGGDLG